MTEDFKKFIKDNRDVHPDRLRMRFHDDTRPWVALAISHIEAERRGRKKFPELMEDWIFPSLMAVEQATPPLTASYNLSVAAEAIGKRLEECSVLDMTAGLGMDAMGFIEASADVTLLELNPMHAQALGCNYSHCRNVKVINGDSVAWLEEYTGKPFDIIFIDPARRTESGARAYNLHHCAPDLIEIMPMILKHAKICIAKLSPMLDIAQTLRDLPDCHELHVVEEAGECRELLAVIGPGRTNGDVRIVVHTERLTIHTDFAGEKSPAICGIPRAGDFVLETSPAITKGLSSAEICYYGVQMAAPNSHVYFGREITEPGLGRWHRIDDIRMLSGAEIKKTGREIGAAEVIARNLPGMTSEKLRARLGVRESSERRIIGTSLSDGRKVLILATKIP